MTSTEELARRAMELSEADGKMEAAIDAERAEKARLLRALVEAARPVLGTIASPVPGDRRGVLLGERLDRGAIAPRLYLLEDGTFFETPATARISIDDVIAERWGVGEISESLATAMDRQLRGVEKAAKRAIDATRVVRAVADLLEGIR